MSGKDELTPREREVLVLRRASAIRRVAAWSLVALLLVLGPACGDDGSAPSTDCREDSTTNTEPGPTSDTVAVTASGTLCDGPRDVIVVRQPSETETIGQQIQRDRYAVIGSVEPGEFDVRIPIGPVVRLRDGTELRPATDKFEVGFR